LAFSDIDNSAPAEFFNDPSRSYPRIALTSAISVHQNLQALKIGDRFFWSQTYGSLSMMPGEDVPKQT
jgi:hypothetical protein